jgi:hypothetical protein
LTRNTGPGTLSVPMKRPTSIEFLQRADGVPMLVVAIVILPL